MYKKVQALNDGSAHDANEALVTNRKPRTWRYYWQKFLSLGQAGGKPHANPDGWPFPTDEDIAERPTRKIKIGDEQEYHFCNNFVKTSKYEVWDFPGKFLMEEFDPTTKVANCYFLMISALQCVGPISNTGGIPTTLIPLLFIILVDATFQLLEDASRHRADTKENASLAHRFDRATGRFEDCKWYEIAVGDYIRIDTRAMVPADVLIISVAEKTEPAQGICYVETKSLDGETNLKIRTALPGTMSKVSAALFSLFHFL
jgi:magnesium-transporting ATPase (P-type)